MNPLPFKSPLVVGYRGVIGSFILQGLLRFMPSASNIWCFDQNECEKKKISRIKKADVIFLCVPMEDTLPWIFKYRHLLKGKTIIEQTSLKSSLYKHGSLLMGYKQNFELKSMHILFRPYATPDKNDRRIALIDPAKWSSEEVDALKKITDSEIQWIVDDKMHDLIMARQQAVLHRILLSLDRTIGNSPKTYLSCKVRALCDRIRTGNPRLYASIQKNPYLPKAMNEFKRHLRKFDIKNEFKAI